MTDHFSDWLITEKHLQGKHDQKTHGSWATGGKISETSPDYNNLTVISGSNGEIIVRRSIDDPKYNEQAEIDLEFRNYRHEYAKASKALYELHPARSMDEIDAKYTRRSESLLKQLFKTESLLEKTSEERGAAMNAGNAAEADRLLKIKEKLIRKRHELDAKIKKNNAEKSEEKEKIRAVYDQATESYSQALFDYTNARSAMGIILGTELAETARLEFIDKFKNDEHANLRYQSLYVPGYERGGIPFDIQMPTDASFSLSSTKELYEIPWILGAAITSKLITANPIMEGSPTIIKFMHETDDGRAYYDDATSSINMSHMGIKRSATVTTVHELGHAIEHRDPVIRRLCQEFLDRRTINTDTGDFDPPEPLRKYGAGYKENEYTRKDKFLSPYMGKDYSRTATEILSMGLQYFVEKPYDLATKDPDMFNFIYAVTRLGGNNTQ
jgi:hypothetical protein